MHFSPPLLHIPDVYLSLPVAIVCWLIAASILAIAIRRTNQSLGERQIPLMGVMAAFIFAAQMINFPTGVGVSGHLLGGVLAAILLGPWSAMLVMTAVIVVQGLLFQDGGLTAMGANILNMGIIPSAIGYGFHRIVLARGRGAKLAVAGFAAWFSVMAGALTTALQLWLSGSAQLQAVVIAMLAFHSVIGLGEAAITVAALGFILRTRPDLMNESAESSRGGRGWIFAGIAISLAVLLLAPFASANPDGLERAALDLGIAPGVSGPAAPALLPDYTVPFLGNTPLSTIAAGVIGLFVVIAIIFFVSSILRKNQPPVENRKQ